MRYLIPGSVLLASAGVLSNCAAGSKTSRESAADAPSVVAMSTSDFKFQAPDSVDAGWITFRFVNNGDDIHYAHIVQLDSAKTVSELLAAYAEAIRTSGARPKWVKRFGGPGGTAPGDTSTVTQQLEPGSYVWICPVEDNEGNPHFGKGEYKTFEVRAAAAGSAEGAAAPTSSTTIRLMDFGFAPEVPLSAGRQTIRVENIGTEPHDLGLLKLAPGKTIEDIRNMLNPERARRPDQASEPPPDFSTLGSIAGGVATMAPGMQAFFEADLTPGDYVLACMVTAPDGRSHIEHGMIHQIHIP